jgi:mono/diheme cytochrome c family protein
MKLVFLSVAILAGVTAFSRPARHATRHHVDKTTLDSVYTAEQAQHGDSIFKATCDKCHGAAAAGTDNDGGRLNGKDFQASWDGVTLDQLHTTILTTMPSDNPKTMTAKDVSDVIAYLLSQNQLPAGSAPLSEIPDSLKSIKFVVNR